MRANFCLVCGSRLNYEEIDGRERGRCVGCNRIHYDQLIVGAGALIELNGRLLLLRRVFEPFKHHWGLPGGHVEADEDPQLAAIREAQEEIALSLKSNGLVDAYFFDDHPKGCGVFLVYRCEIVGGVMSETAEAETPTFFVRSEIPRNWREGATVRQFSRGSARHEHAATPRFRSRRAFK